MKAFPNIQLTVSEMGQVRAINEVNAGMELRDYFAAQAMKHMGLPLKGSRGDDSCWYIDDMDGFPYDEFPYDGYANVAYKFADAMMKARNK